MRRGAVSTQFAIALALSLVAGLVIGWMDSRPGFDDTGVTASALFLAAGVSSFIATRLPWLFAVTTGVWLPIFELPGVASGGPLLAFALSGVGAVVGWFVARRSSSVGR